MIKLREVEDKDLVPVATFLAREFPFSLEKGFPYTTKEFWLGYFELWWEKNPAYSDHFPRGWILEKDTTVVGFIGNIPVKFLICGEIHIAASANAWYENPSVRGVYSLKLFSEFLKQKSPALFLFKIGDESFISFLARYGFKHYILPAFQKEYVFIINKRKIRYIFSRLLLNIIKPANLSEVLEIYKRFWFLLCAYLYQKPLVADDILQGGKFQSSVCTSCDDSFSQLWEPHMSSSTISISRDTKTLNWLYFSSSRFRKRVVIQCRQSSDNNLAGYMVFDIQRIKTTDEATMQLMDICIGDHDPLVLASLTSCAIEAGKQNGASLLVIWSDDFQTERYFRNTFTMRIIARYHRFIRFQDNYEKISGRKNVCPPMIHPPQ